MQPAIKCHKYYIAIDMYNALRMHYDMLQACSWFIYSLTHLYLM